MTRTVGDTKKSAHAGRSKWSARTVSTTVVFALICVLGLVLVVDVWTLPARWAFPKPIRATTLVEVAAAQTRARMLNVLVAAAARDLSDDKVESLLVPEGLGAELTLEQDTFNGLAQDTITPGLLDLFVGGTAASADYPAVLDAALIRGWKDQGILVEYPRFVYGVVPSEPTGRFLLFTDADGAALYVVPESLLPVGSLSSGGDG